MQNNFSYCPSITGYKRRKARIVNIGDVPLGGTYPIRIQSMTTTPTMDTQATVNEAIRIIEVGAEYIRITTPRIREAENLKNIKYELRKRGYNQPLIADIHYTPGAAIAAARIVEKVRINPGNYADKKHFKIYKYTDDEYSGELNRIYERFAPLVKICKECGTAMRIGINHGSLSDRIISRYGDTPIGMVESALEFIRICEDLHYYDIVLSMKASNPVIMVEAYRLLVNRMNTEGMNYPLHLGVTEAGIGEEGRIKSAIGIGTLLEDGLGDTIRVSLTEPPENEIPVARQIVKRYENRKAVRNSKSKQKTPINPFSYTKRETIRIGTICGSMGIQPFGTRSAFGGKEHPRVIADFQNIVLDRTMLAPYTISYNDAEASWNISDTAPDFIYIGSKQLNFIMPQEIGVICDYSVWCSLENRKNIYPLIPISELTPKFGRIDCMKFVTIPINEFNIKKVENLSRTVLVLDGGVSAVMVEFRSVFFKLIETGIQLPVIIKKDYSGLDDTDFLLYSASDIGGLLIDGFGDGIWLTPASALSNRTVFNILQASRTRISKTEYISCPGCGRTVFNLQEICASIYERTSHLKGLKIAIMGCIVNGPGEMADADYGYVGTGADKVSLYRGKKMVKHNIRTERAVNELVTLIKEDGCWKNPPQ